MNIMDSFKTISTADARKYLQDGIIDVKTCNRFEQTVLFFAVQNPFCGEELSRMLVQEYHANPNHQDERGQTALFYLAKNGRKGCFEFLETCEIDVNHRDHHGQTALFFAAAGGQSEMIRALCNAGVSVNLKDLGGRSALFWVGDSAASVKALFDMNANFNCQTRDKKTILDKAKSAAKDLPNLATQLRAYHTLYNVKGKVAARVSSNGSFEVVMLAGAKDVDQLCALESEFVEDHRTMLKNLTEQELFKEIGLHQDPKKRREVIQSITNVKSTVGLREGYTLKTVFYPSQGHEKQAITPVISGYLYFKLRDVLSSLGSTMVPVDPTGSPVDGIPKIVVSHLKVARAHQRKGVAKLILSGMLRFLGESLERAQADSLMTRKILELQLSVVDANKHAIALYESLGFRKGSQFVINENKSCIWHSMVCPVDVDLEHIASRWTQMSMGREAGPVTLSRQAAGSAISPQAKKRRLLPGL